jgi:glycosyltransferase involved in cell wall biosynthesis
VTRGGPRAGRSYRVALVHSFYASGTPSGENIAVLEQARALEAAGHEVALVAARTDELVGSPWYPLRAAVTVATGLGRSPVAALRELRPDIVHVHNLFPNFGTSWLSSWPGPLLATLHNFRPLCAKGTLYRNGEVCTRCPDGRAWDGLVHGCYRGSRAATLPLAWAGRGGPAHSPLLTRADRLVALSSLSREVYIRAGVPAGRLALIANPVMLPRPSSPVPKPCQVPPSGELDGRWLFAGRLSEEKGILQLLQRWPATVPLDVVGSGPLLAQCRRSAPPAVRFLGPMRRPDLLAALPSCIGLVISSRWFEVMPMIYAEALAAGVPVLAFRGSTVARLVNEQGTGLTVSWSEPLWPRLAELAAHAPELRERCRRAYREHYAARGWAVRMTALYQDVCQDVAGGCTGGVHAADPAAAGTRNGSEEAAMTEQP